MATNNPQGHNQYDTPPHHRGSDAEKQMDKDDKNKSSSQPGQQSQSTSGSKSSDTPKQQK